LLPSLRAGCADLSANGAYFSPDGTEFAVQLGIHSFQTALQPLKAPAGFISYGPKPDHSLAAG